MDATSDPYSSTVHALNENTSWTCRKCAASSAEPFRYAAAAGAYCSRCGDPLSEIERHTIAMLDFTAAMRRRASNRGAAREGEDEDQGAKLVNVTRAAKLIGVTGKALYCMVDRGEIPEGVVVRVGRRLRFSPSRLLSWAEKQGVQSPPRRRR